MEEKKIKILLVDDEADFRKMMMFWLKSKGYDVVQAEGGLSGIQVAKKEKPAIIFLDLRMPDINGVETLKRIREFDKNVPVIVISAYVNDPGTEEMTSYGISGVFYKGKNFEEALPLLESALRIHKKLKK